MKKSLLVLLMSLFAREIVAQCVLSCTNYVPSSINYSVFPTGPTITPTSFFPHGDDGTLTAVPIGFNFDYYCDTYSTVIICTNGFIQLDYGTPPDFTNPYVHPAQTFPDPTPPNGIVALNMCDMDPSQGGAISYTTVGSAPNRMFIVTYSNVPTFGTANLNNGQIVLYETSNLIEIHTGQVFPAQHSSPNGTQGLEDKTGSYGSVPPGRNNNTSWHSSASNTAYRFERVYEPLPPTAISGTLSSCAGIQRTYTVTPMPGATSYSWNLPPFWTGTANSNTIYATTGTSGQLSVTATYSCGTSSAATLFVNVIPSPVVSISSATPPIFCSGKTTTIMTAGAATYTLNPGNHTGLPPFYDTPMVTTVYTVTGTDSSGCLSDNLATYTVGVNATPTITVNDGTICIGESFVMNPQGADYKYYYSTTFNQVTPTFTGVSTYSVWGENGNGCKSDTIISSVMVVPLPLIGATASPSAICIKEASTLTPMGGVSYVWKNITAPNSTVQVKPIGNTVYSVTGTDANGCVNSATVAVRVSQCVGIEDSSAETALLRLYPNPAHDQLSVRMDFDGQVTIYDALGRSVYQADFTAGLHQVDLKEFPAGKYMMSARSADIRRNAVFVKN